MPRAAVLFFAVLLPGLVLAQESGPKPVHVVIDASRSEGTYNRSVDVLFYCSDPLATLRFRFLPESSDWFPADRTLVLDAALREVRSYSIVVEAQKSGVTVGSKSFFWTIDRKPPAAPVPSIPEGIVKLPFALSLSSEEGSTIYWSVFGAGSDSSRFQSLPSILIRSLEGLSEDITVCAYAVDAYGNTGVPGYYRYVLARQDAVFASRAMKDSPAAPGSIAPALPLELKAVPAETDSGFILDLGELDRDAVPVVSVSDSRTSPGMDTFAEVIRDKDSAPCAIPAPYGYLRPLYAYWGLRSKDGKISFSSVPVDLVRKPTDFRKVVPAAPEPYVSSLPDGCAVLSFPDSRFSLEYRLGGDSWTGYESPVSLGAYGGKTVEIAWRAAGPDGSRGPESKRTVAVSKAVRAASILGIPGSGVANAAFKIRAEGQEVVRFEVSDNGSVPAEVTGKSPVLVPDTVFDSGPGKTVSFRMRYRTFADSSETAERSGERLLAFTVDREPPPVPVLSPDSTVTGFSSQDGTVSFRDSGNQMTYVLEDSRGVKSPELPYAGPILLKAPETGRIAYTIRARSADPAGNVSPWSSPVTVSLDKSSVYVSQSGSDSSPGTPSRPLKSLEAAIASCAASGKKVVYLSGSAVVSRPVVFSRDISVYGGYGADFMAAGTEPSSITIADGFPGTPFTVEKGVSVLLESVSVSGSGSAGVPLLSVQGGLRLGKASFALYSRGNAVWIQSSGGRIDCSQSSFYLSSGMSQTLFGLSGAALSLSDSTVSASDNVMFASLFRLDSCESSISNCRIATSSGGGTQIALAVGGTFAFSRNLVTGRGTGAFFRLVSSRGTGIVVSNSIMDVDAKCEFTAVESGNGNVSFTHNTLLSGPAVTGGTVLSLDGDEIEFANNLLVSSGVSFFAAKGKGVTGTCRTNAWYGSPVLSSDAPLATFLAPGFVPVGGSAGYRADGKGMPSLYRGSPCVDAGSRSADDGIDFSGAGRSDGKPDIGALELNAP